MPRLRWAALWPFAIVAFALLPLLEIQRVYHADWANHGWLMEYYGLYLRAHGWFPRIVNTHQLTGMALPLFYGHLMYALGGVFTSVVGGDWGIRIVIALMMLWQCLCIRGAVRAVGGGEAVGNGLAALACWTIYPLTNLYNRGAVTEFFAIAALTCAVCFLLCLALAERARTPWKWITGMALAFSLVTVHPITAVYGGVFLAFLWLVAIVASRKRRVLAIAAACAVPVVMAVTAPQVYMLVRWSPTLRVALRSASEKLIYLPSDRILSRLSPFPFDISSLRMGANLETAYLDAQLNLPLLLLTSAAMVFTRWRGVRAAQSLTLGAWAALLFTFLLSVTATLAATLGPLVNRLQFAYRLVSYQDLAIVVAAICLIHAHARGGLPSKPWMVPLFAAALAIAGVATMEKWTRGSASPRPGAIGSSQEKTLLLPATFYALDDYTTNLTWPAGALPRQPAVFPVLAGKQFGELDTLAVSLPGPAVLDTNVSAFALNRILVDGFALPWDQMRREGVTFALTVPAGHHTLECRFDPGEIWIFLRAASEVIVVLIGASYLWLSGAGLMSRRLGGASPLHDEHTRHQHRRPNRQ